MSGTEQLKVDIEQHREELAQTVDLMARKLDVKSQAQRKLAPAKPFLLPAGVVTVLALVIWKWRS